jgi:hypothetical protein
MLYGAYDTPLPVTLPPGLTKRDNVTKGMNIGLSRCQASKGRGENSLK